MEGNEAEKLTVFFETIGKLKKIRKTGMVKSGVKEAESVADHSLRVAAMALFLARKLGCDENKLVKMAIVHDLHESICGDLTLDYTAYGSQAGLPPEEKKRREMQAMEEFCALLECGCEKDFKELWLEAEKGATKEAQVLHEIDKLEMLLQAAEYQREGNGRADLFSLFYRVNEKEIKIPLLRKILEETVKRTP